MNVLSVALLMLTVSVLGRPAAAQALSLELDGGAVTLHATNVTVDEILARWSETTGLTVVSQNGHGSDIPVTLHLSGVSEREALRLVLRDLSGYIMGERVDPRTGDVRIDRLVILPDSAPKLTDVAPAAARLPPNPSRDTVPEQLEAVPVELAPQVDLPAQVER